MRATSLGYLYVVLSSIFFALMSIVGKSAFNTGMKAYDLLIMQTAVSVLVLLGYFWLKDPKLVILTRSQLKNVILQGLFGSTATTVLFYLSLERINAGIASMLIFLHPVFVTVFFLLTGLRKISWVNNLALMLAVAGSVMVLNVFHLDVAGTSVLGLIYGVACSICYAFYNIYADLRLRDIQPAVVAMYTSLVMLVVSILLNPGFFRPGLSLSAWDVFYVVELAVVSGILPVIFLYRGIAMVGSEKATIIATCELPLTLVLAFLVLRETMSLAQVLGVAFIIGAVFVLQNEAVIRQRLSLGSLPGRD